MSTIIKLRCIDQVLTFDSTPLIASGGVEEDRVQVEFCPKWDGLVKTAVFWRNEKEAFHVLLDEDDSCAIPKEVIIDEGRIYLGFFGVSAEEKQRTSQVLAYNVVKGAITLDSAPDSPTVDIYTQLLARYDEVLDLLAGDLLPDGAVSRPKLSSELQSSLFPVGSVVYMSAANWAGNTYSFEDMFPGDQYDISIEVAPTATSDQFEEFGAAMICGSLDGNVATALGDVPTLDIPVIVKAVTR